MSKERFVSPLNSLNALNSHVTIIISNLIGFSWDIRLIQLHLSLASATEFGIKLMSYFRKHFAKKLGHCPSLSHTRIQSHPMEVIDIGFIIDKKRLLFYFTFRGGL